MKRGNEDGVALLLALLIVVLLTTIVVEYAYEISVEAALIANGAEDAEAYIAAKSAVASGVGLLVADAIAAADAGQEHVGLQDMWSYGVPNQKLNETTIRCTVTDTYGKLNLNALLGEFGNVSGQSEKQDGGQAPDTGGPALLEAAFRALFQARGAEVDPTDAILDWMDPDDEPRPEGAESDYYASLDIPYACKNGPMDSVDELLLIKGVTLDLFFGLPDQEPPQRPLDELVTVRGHPEGMINANTAPEDVLYAVCEARFPGESHRAEQAMARRDEEPFYKLEDLEDLLRSPPPENKETPPEPEIFIVTSEVFRVQGDGMTETSAVRIEAHVKRPAERAAEIVRVLDWRVIR